MNKIELTHEEAQELIIAINSKISQIGSLDPIFFKKRIEMLKDIRERLQDIE